jgi:hypothetical protein
VPANPPGGSSDEKLFGNFSLSLRWVRREVLAPVFEDTTVRLAAHILGSLGQEARINAALFGTT